MTFLRRLARFARRHAAFGAVLMAAAAVRIVAMIGYPGAMLTSDSADYVVVALRMEPYNVRPSGYPAMLWLLKPFHSLAIVAGVQDGLGLCTGSACYALLRRRTRLPGWAAAVATVPVLLSAYAIQIEHFLLSDTLFAALVTAAVVVMLWRPDPPLWMYALTGCLLAAAALVRLEGMALLIAFLVFVLVRWAGWRTTVAALVMCAAFAVPLTAYAAWFDSVHGTFRLTTSDGAFLYARVTTFAECAKIKPPAAEQALCLNVPPDKRYFSPNYIWSSFSPIAALPGGAFGPVADSLGSDFAVRAITAQPLDYLHAVGNSFWESFLPHRGVNPGFQLRWAAAKLQEDYMFPVAPEEPPRYIAASLSRYGQDSSTVRVVEPYADWVRLYQRFIVVSGPLLGAIMLIGLAGLLVNWRRAGGAALLPWLTGLCLLLTPALVADFDPRYLVCAVPPLCLAAAIGAEQIIRRYGRPSPTAGRTAVPAGRAR